MINKTILVRNSTKENPSFNSYNSNFYQSYRSCRKSDLELNQGLFIGLLKKNENILLDGYSSAELVDMTSKAQSLGYEIIEVD